MNENKMDAMLLDSKKVGEEDKEVLLKIIYILVESSIKWSQRQISIIASIMQETLIIE